MEILKPGFVYQPTIIGVGGDEGPPEPVLNIIPLVGLNYMIGAAFTGVSQFSNWYLGLFDNNWTPATGDTMTTLIASAGENVAYTGTARQAIVFPAVSGGALTTSADPNVFAFTSSETIRGAFITTGSAWGGTSGLLVSAVLFTSPKTVVSGESLSVPVGFGLVSGV